MKAQIRLDQWILDVEYSYESGDDFYSSGWIDLSILSGTICLEESHSCYHSCEECVDMTDDEVHCVGEMFGNEIQRKLVEGLRDDDTG